MNPLTFHLLTRLRVVWFSHGFRKASVVPCGSQDLPSSQDRPKAESRPALHSRPPPSDGLLTRAS